MYYTAVIKVASFHCLLLANVFYQNGFNHYFSLSHLVCW